VVKLYVEGGGDLAVLKTACRRGFTTFITQAGIKKHPRVVACGGREDAYKSFCITVANGEKAMLLVDSETAVAAPHQSGLPDKWLPWGHLLQRDNWKKPAESHDTDCHLMVQVMESWFLADQATLQAFFNRGFNSKALPAAANPIEGVAKDTVYRALQKATKDCKTKDPYEKGEHSFALLTMIDPTKVTAASPWAKRFVEELKKKMK
jgi:hypothetical protein